MVFSRSLKKAKRAYEKRDISATIIAHSKKSTEKHKEGGRYIKSIVYGGLDGIITTFAIISGVVGASLSAGVVLVLGFANLIADGISMGIGDYLSSKSEQEYYKSERRREQWEIDNYPEGEKKEMEELYVNRGMNSKDAKKLVTVISKNKKAWLDIMMAEELGLIHDNTSPFKKGIVTFISFAIFGFIPIFAFLLTFLNPLLQKYAFLIASIMTGITLFILGALKVKITCMNWLKSGFEMLFAGGLAAGAAYYIGYLLSGLV